MMTSRERLLTVLSGNIPDRVSAGFFIQEEYLSWYYPDRSIIRRLEESVDCANELDFDLMVRSKEFEQPHFFKKSYRNWEVDTKEVLAGDILHIYFTIKTPKGELIQEETAPYQGRSTGGIHRSVKSYLIKSQKDFEIFKQYIPEPDKDDMAHIKEYSAYAKKLIGQRGIFAPWGYSGVYNQASLLMDVQQLMMNAYIEPGFYTEYMETITDVTADHNEILAGSDVDCVGIQGNIANSGMVGKDFFDTYILPYEKRLVKRIKDNGRYTIYHNCGRAAVLMESYADMGITAWETVSEAPSGDTTLKDAKKAVGDRLVLIGNLDQVHFLKEASPEQVRTRVEQIIADGKPGGRYIFAASDFLETDTPIINVKAAIAACKEFGVY